MQLGLILMKYMHSFLDSKQGYKSHRQGGQSMRRAKKGHCIQRCENHVACIVEKICDYKFADSKRYRSGCVLLVLLQEPCYLYCYKICNYEFAEDKHYRSVWSQ